MTEEKIKKIKALEFHLMSVINDEVNRFSEELMMVDPNYEYFQSHIHICDFELEDKLFNRKGFKKQAKKKCVSYLGHKPDEDLACCDDCPHMRYIAFDYNKEVLYIL